MRTRAMKTAPFRKSHHFPLAEHPGVSERTADNEAVLSERAVDGQPTVESPLPSDSKNGQSVYNRSWKHASKLYPDLMVGRLWNVFRVSRHDGSVEFSHFSIFDRDTWEVDEVSVTLLVSEFVKGLFDLNEKGQAKIEGTSGSLELSAGSKGDIRAAIVSANGLKTSVFYIRTSS